MHSVTEVVNRIWPDWEARVSSNAEQLLAGYKRPPVTVEKAADGEMAMIYRWPTVHGLATLTVGLFDYQLSIYNAALGKYVLDTCGEIPDHESYAVPTH
jgi:hypothetical protein